MASTILFDPPKAVVSQLNRSTKSDPRPIVVMTCGLAGMLCDLSISWHKDRNHFLF
jgi:hypothetical protein